MGHPVHNLGSVMIYGIVPGGRAVVPPAAAAPVGGAAPVVQVLAARVPARVDAMLTCKNREGIDLAEST